MRIVHTLSKFYSKAAGQIYAAKSYDLSERPRSREIQGRFLGEGVSPEGRGHPLGLVAANPNRNAENVRACARETLVGRPLSGDS